MENEKTMESPQEPLQEGVGNNPPTTRRRHRRPSQRNAATAAAETAVQSETAAAAPTKSVQSESAAADTPAPERPAGAAAAVGTAAVTPAAPATPATLAASAPSEPQGARKSAVPQKNEPEAAGAKPAAPQKPVSEVSGAKPAAAQKSAAQSKNAPAQRQETARPKDSAPQRPAGAPNERRNAAPQKPVGQTDRKAAAMRNAAANDRKANTNTARRTAETPKRPATPPKRSSDRPATDGGWTWRGYLCRLSVVILGTALTLLGAGLIGRWQEARQVRGAMLAVYEELTANRAAVGIAGRNLLRDGRGLQPRDGDADGRATAVSPTANPMTLRAAAASAPVLRDEAWQVLCASGVVASVRDGELLRDVAGCYADMDRFARQLEGGDASGADAAQAGRSAAGRIDRVLRQLESKYGFGQ